MRLWPGFFSAEVCWRVKFLLSILWYLKVDPQSLQPDKSLLLNVTKPPPHVRLESLVLAQSAGFLFAMLSKGSVAILPLVLLLIVWWQRRQIMMRDLAGTAPFFLTAVVMTGVNIWFQTHDFYEFNHSTSFGERLLGQRLAVLSIQGAATDQFGVCLPAVAHRRPATCYGGCHCWRSWA